MMTLSEQRSFRYNCLLKDIKGSLRCVFKVRQYFSQLIRFAKACSNVRDFNNRNKFLTAKLLKQDYWYHKLSKVFSNFNRRHTGI